MLIPYISAHCLPNLIYKIFTGNDYIHAISINGQHRARFILEKDGIKRYADYSNFRVEDEHSKYLLKVSGYSGTAGMLSHRVHIFLSKVL